MRCVVVVGGWEEVVGGWKEVSEVVEGWEMSCYQLEYFLFVTQLTLKVKKIN